MILRHGSGCAKYTAYFYFYLFIYFTEKHKPPTSVVDYVTFSNAPVTFHPFRDSRNFDFGFLLLKITSIDSAHRRKQPPTVFI